ncbi:DUF6518 family protein [Goekera deserti]|uniref:DUF6518 family protein n=1 Tax=Goekera deserti TaxID=2497753 RepID=UPI0022A79271|nr:DUF6518 family protein [Goekera deserti]
MSPPAPTATGRPRAAVPRWAVAVLVGLMVGALTSPAQTLLGSTVLSGLTNAVGPWLVAPFLVAARARTPRAAAWVGVLACVAQVPGYYAVSAARGFAITPVTVAQWTLAGVVGGAALGLAGWSWWTPRGRWCGLGAALLVAVWLAEGVVLFGLVLGYTGQALVACGVGVALALLLGRHEQQHRALLRWLLPAVAVGALGFAVALLVL